MESAQISACHVVSIRMKASGFSYHWTRNQEIQGWSLTLLLRIAQPWAGLLSPGRVTRLALRASGPPCSAFWSPFFMPHAQTPPLWRIGVRRPATQRRSASFSVTPGVVPASRTSIPLVSNLVARAVGTMWGESWPEQAQKEGGSFRGSGQGMDRSQWGWN